MARVANGPSFSCHRHRWPAVPCGPFANSNSPFISLAQPAFRIAADGRPRCVGSFPQETTMTTKIIRALNDTLRQNLQKGTAVMTPGVAALGAEAVACI